MTASVGIIELHNGRNAAQIIDSATGVPALLFSTGDLAKDDEPFLQIKCTQRGWLDMFNATIASVDEYLNPDDPRSAMRLMDRDSTKTVHFAQVDRRPALNVNDYPVALQTIVDDEGVNTISIMFNEPQIVYSTIKPALIEMQNCKHDEKAKFVQLVSELLLECGVAVNTIVNAIVESGMQSFCWSEGGAVLMGDNQAFQGYSARLQNKFSRGQGSGRRGI